MCPSHLKTKVEYIRYSYARYDCAFQPFIVKVKFSTPDFAVSVSVIVWDSLLGRLTYKFIVALISTNLYPQKQNVKRGHIK